MTRKWKKSSKGISQQTLKNKDAQKGTFYSGSRSDYVSYIRKGIMKAFVPAEGNNKIRIIEPIETDELNFYGLEMHFHRAVGDREHEDDNMRSIYGDYLCMNRMSGILRPLYKDQTFSAKCFRCEQQTEELWESDPNLAKSFYPDRRMWMFVMDLKADNPNEIRYWSAPWSLHEDILSHSQDAETGDYVEVGDPDTGVPVSFDRSGKGKLTKYTNVQIFKNPMPLDEAVVVEAMIEFVDLLVIPEDEILQAATLSEYEGFSIPGAQESSPKPAEEPQPEEAAIEQEQDSDGHDPCFQKEFDKYQDCDGCKDRVECENKPEPKKIEKPAKPAKPEKPQRVEREPRAEKATDTDADIEAKKQKIRDKIAASTKGN